MIRVELHELVKKAQAGDALAVDEICLRFTGLVKKYAFQPHICSIAEEAQGQGWLAVVQGIRQYDEQCGVPFAGYIESRVKYAVWNLFKRERRLWQQEGPLDSEQEEGLSILQHLADKADVATEVELQWLSEELMAVIATLPDKQQQVIYKATIEEQRLTKIAMQMGITTQAVFNLRQRGFARLKILCAGMYRDIRQ